jgi:hypothetical protein
MDDIHKLDKIDDMDYAYNVMLIPWIILKWRHCETKLNHMNETHHMDEIGGYWLNHFIHVIACCLYCTFHHHVFNFIHIWQLHLVCKFCKLINFIHKHHLSTINFFIIEFI